MSLDLRSVNSATLPADFSAVKGNLSLSSAPIVVPVEETTISSYALISDIFNQPVLILKITQGRDIFQQGQTSLLYFTVALEDPLHLVQADDTRLEQVIQNFVGNAIKFCPPGSTVQVSTSMKDQALLLEVSDSGPSLTDTDQAKVFTKYARLSNKPTGGEKSSGLGLAICRQIVELHGGAIGVRNNPVRGATFWFSIPQVASATA